MHMGFNIKLNNQSFTEEEKGYGNNIYTSNKKQIQTCLSNYIGKDGNIQSEQLEKDWFPDIKADVFISHAHKDKETVVAFAGWLEKNWGLTSFIDFSVWNHAEHLLRQIDDEYCANRDENKIITSYQYKMRNESTAHVYLLLNIALAKMIAKTNCLFFINTPNSISAKDICNEEYTNSAWIYSELMMFQLLSTTQIEIANENYSIPIQYPAATNNLHSLDFQKLLYYYLKNTEKIKNAPLEQKLKIIQSIAISQSKFTNERKSKLENVKFI